MDMELSHADTQHNYREDRGCQQRQFTARGPSEVDQDPGSNRQPECSREGSEHRSDGENSALEPPQQSGERQAPKALQGATVASGREVQDPESERDRQRDDRGRGARIRYRRYEESKPGDNRAIEPMTKEHVAELGRMYMAAGHCPQRDRRKGGRGDKDPSTRQGCNLGRDGSAYRGRQLQEQL